MPASTSAVASTCSREKGSWRNTTPLTTEITLLQGLATALVLAGIYCVNILHSIYTARRQAAAEQKEQTV